MITVYVLKNKINEEHYTGISSDPSRRLIEHNTGKNRFTKAFIPWHIVYTEVQPDFLNARKREKYLKSGAGRRWLKKEHNI